MGGSDQATVRLQRQIPQGASPMHRESLNTGGTRQQKVVLGRTHLAAAQRNSARAQRFYLQRPTPGS